MTAIFKRRVTNDDGASAVEYGLLIAGIAALIVATVWLFGGMVADVFTHTCTTVSSHASPSSTC